MSINGKEFPTNQITENDIKGISTDLKAEFQKPAKNNWLEAAEAEMAQDAANVAALKKKITQEKLHQAYLAMKTEFDEKTAEAVKKAGEKEGQTVIGFLKNAGNEIKNILSPEKQMSAITLLTMLLGTSKAVSASQNYENPDQDKTAASFVMEKGLEEPFKLINPDESGDILKDPDEQPLAQTTPTPNAPQATMTAMSVEATQEAQQTQEVLTSQEVAEMLDKSVEAANISSEGRVVYQIIKDIMIDSLISSGAISRNSIVGIEVDDTTADIYLKIEDSNHGYTSKDYFYVTLGINAKEKIIRGESLDPREDFLYIAGEGVEVSPGVYANLENLRHSRDYIMVGTYVDANGNILGTFAVSADTYQWENIMYAKQKVANTEYLEALAQKAVELGIDLTANEGGNDLSAEEMAALPIEEQKKIIEASYDGGIVHEAIVMDEETLIFYDGKEWQELPALEDYNDQPIPFGEVFQMSSAEDLATLEEIVAHEEQKVKILNNINKNYPEMDFVPFYPDNDSWKWKENRTYELNGYFVFNIENKIIVVETTVSPIRTTILLQENQSGNFSTRLFMDGEGYPISLAAIEPRYNFEKDASGFSLLYAKDLTEEDIKDWLGAEDFDHNNIDQFIEQLENGKIPVTRVHIDMHPLAD
jgi:hypothetical protein